MNPARCAVLAAVAVSAALFTAGCNVSLLSSKHYHYPEGTRVGCPRQKQCRMENCPQQNCPRNQCPAAGAATESGG